MNRISFVLTLLLIGFCSLSIYPSYAKERAEKMTILLVPVGEIDKKLMESLKRDLGKMFNKRIEAGPEMPHPDFAFNRARNQYLSTAILKAIMERKGHSGHGKILAVVDQDLYVSELNFVFGEASRKAAVISLTRLRQEFYHLPQDQDVFYKRVLTEAVHELGHTYGLSHCKNPQCVMFFSNSLIDTDRKGPEFCPECKRELLKGE